MVFKTASTILLISVTMVFAGAKHHAKHATARLSAAPSAMALGMDSMFIKVKQDFDEVVASPIVKGKDASAMNAYFFKVLKEHQPFYSFTRVDSKGEVVGEVIRLVDKPDTKQRNLSKEPWVRQSVKKRTEYSGMIKLEETGRYYALWAAPVMGKNKKGGDISDGAVALKVDLWDCFHKYANNAETPFLVRIGRLHLYSNKWKDSIGYTEDRLSVAGIKKIFVRYPKALHEAPVVAAVAAPVRPASPPPTVDSARIKASQDSLKAAQNALLKQKQQKKNALIIAIVVLIVLIAGLLFLTIPMIRQRMIMNKIDKSDDI